MPAPAKMSEVTADGDIVVGRVRPKNNPLIHRSEVGKPSFHNDLPPLPEDYTFGAPLKRDPEGAGEVMLSWQSHAPPKSKMAYDFGRNFLALNRQSVGAGCTDAKTASDFRKYHDVRIKPKVTGSKPTIAPSSVMQDPGHAFGARSGESESVADLIQNRWEYEWVAEQKHRMESIERSKNKEAKRRASPARRAARITPAAAAARQSATPHPRETFTLRQFRNVPSRVSPHPGDVRSASAMGSIHQ
uniref:Cilia- and flagella-associated protein 77 n=1 Tax=Neobodo designis TaxID=312471 RepID=A0A7S1QEL3_NEODS|eukprot:CAMPEP_0174851786 /NCGR_PEP_ID=MMETSP1114-20130205/23877_1 /TAXON_ID=312471 /ORGANISM="Neobodo designis, Strain CCAP 1951/1" /LENGTH=244 /DNA_ID=CAMNT_0016086343 /DNA_START=77 /DNA_END=811 /DNA_ORIENTATION=+